MTKHLPMHMRVNDIILINEKINEKVVAGENCICQNVHIRCYGRRLRDNRIISSVIPGER